MASPYRLMTPLTRCAAALVVTGAAILAGIAAAAGTAATQPVAIATGQDAGWPDVRGWTRIGDTAEQIAPWGNNQFEFAPYPTYQYGVRVAVGDVTGDGKPEIVTAPAKGGWTEIRIFDGTKRDQIGAFAPFRGSGWWNGAFVATGDTNGDGKAEVIDGLDAGFSTMVHVLDGTSGEDRAGFWPYSTTTETGVRVAAADLNGDGKAEILAVPLDSTRVSGFGTGGGNPFRVYDTFPGGAFGGATIAAGDVTGDGAPEIVAAARTSSGFQVNVVDTKTGALVTSLHPFVTDPTSTPQITVGDVDGDGHGDIVLLAQLADGALLKALAADGRELASFYVLEPGIVPGASVAAGDLDGDGKAEIVIGGGPTPTAPWPPVTNGPDQRVVVYRSNGTFVGGLTAYPGLFQGGTRVAVADVEHNGWPDVITAPGHGMEPEVSIFSQRWFGNRDRGNRLTHFLAYEGSFGGGVSVAAGYWSGDPRIVTAPGPGRVPEVRVFDPQGRLLSSFLAFEASYTGGLSVATGDLDADGAPEIVVGTLAAPARIRAFDIGGTPSGPLIGPFPPDGRGVQVGVADPNGSGRGLIVAAAATGSNPTLELVDPVNGGVVRVTHPFAAAADGLRVGSGDLDRDGRDEILVAPAWAPSGAAGEVAVLGSRLRRMWSWSVYGWPGSGINVAATPRNGLPLRSQPLTVRLRVKTHTRVVVARFDDAARLYPTSRFRATIAWGDGSAWRGVVLRRSASSIEVRSSKRYARSGTYRVTVRLTDDQSRVAVAKSTARVRAK